ncbi:MAG: tetratricopeptide repeat protein, partial [Bacteroidota bacterium]
FYLPALDKAAIIAYNAEQDFSKAYNLYTMLERAADSDDKRFEAQLGALRSAYRLNNTSAVEQYAAKVANNPNATADQQLTANFYLGKIAYDRQQYDRALPYFEQVIANSDNEQTAEARYLRANIYYLRRELDRAQQLTMEANRESSGYPYWVAKSVILLADILRDKRDLYNARAALEALLENYNEDQEIVAEAREKLARVEAEINQTSRLNNATTNPQGNNYLELDNGNNGGRN